MNLLHYDIWDLTLKLERLLSSDTHDFTHLVFIFIYFLSYIIHYILKPHSESFF